jgi:hypothetical protein
MLFLLDVVGLWQLQAAEWYPCPRHADLLQCLLTLIDRFQLFFSLPEAQFVITLRSSFEQSYCGFEVYICQK